MWFETRLFGDIVIIIIIVTLYVDISVGFSEHLLNCCGFDIIWFTSKQLYNV